MPKHVIKVTITTEDGTVLDYVTVDDDITQDYERVVDMARAVIEHITMRFSEKEGSDD